MKSLFSFRLYREGLHRQRLGGVVAAIVMLISLNNPITSLVTYWMVGDTGMVDTIALTPTHLISPLCLLMPYAVACSAAAYSFMLQRNACDFYDALPYRRLSIYFNFLLGALTWIVGIAVVCFGLRCLFYSLCPHFVYDLGDAILALASAVASCLFVFACSTLAYTCAGNKVSYIAIFGIFFLDARVVASAWLDTIGEVAPHFDVSASPLVVLSWDYFLPWSLLNSAVDIITDKGVVLNPVAISYYFITALGLMILGGLAYVKRPGTTPRNPATSPQMQHLWRMLVTLPFAVQVASGILLHTNDFLEGDLWTFSLAVLLPLVATIGAYFLYELFSAGKLRQIKSLLLHLLWMLVPMVVFALSVLITKWIV